MVENVVNVYIHLDFNNTELNTDIKDCVNIDHSYVLQINFIATISVYRVKNVPAYKIILAKEQKLLVFKLTGGDKVGSVIYLFPSFLKKQSRVAHVSISSKLPRPSHYCSKGLHEMRLLKGKKSLRLSSFVETTSVAGFT